MENIKEKNSTDIFRLASLLYKDENYNIKKENIIRKIIESVFIDDNLPKKIYEIIKICEEKYMLTFVEEEVMNIVYNNQEQFIVKRGNGSNEIRIQLSEMRFKNLEAFKSCGLEEYLGKFIENTRYDDEKYVKELIYKFLYEIFTSNLNSYQYFLNKKEDSDGFSVDYKNYKDSEKEIINSFLNYSDSKKDKVIFDIVSLSLEYCILTGNNKQIYMQGINNKIFYLDTNIIYRAVGINGKDREVLTCKFLKKCLDLKIQLVISKYSEQEFKNSLKYHCKQLTRYKHNNINESVYLNYAAGYGIYNFYYEWRSGRNNTDINLFLAKINSLYSEIIEKYKINIDYSSCYYGEEDKEIIEEINKLASNIGIFKINSSMRENQVDANNVSLVRKIRKNNGDLNKKFLETKYFFISTDQKLREWDYMINKYETPVVLLPSQWLSIVLRFISRTPDDYRSFVSFLNLKKNTSVIDKDKLNAVLCGISELTEDIHKQKKYAREIIELKVKDIINLENNDDIYKETIEHVKKSIDKILDESQEKILKMKNFENETNEKLINEKKKTDQYRNLLKEKYISENLKKWEKKGWIAVAAMFITIPYAFLQIFFLDSKYNFVYKLVQCIEKNYSEGSKWMIFSISSMVSLTLNGMLIRFIYNRFSKTKKYKEKKEELKINADNEYEEGA